MKFLYHVIVDTDTKAHADHVLNERVYFEEDYGFDYTIDYSEPETPRVAKGQTWQAGSLELTVVRVGQDGSWADVRVADRTTDAKWSKRQMLVEGRFAFDALLVSQR